MSYSIQRLILILTCAAAVVLCAIALAKNHTTVETYLAWAVIAFAFGVFVDHALPAVK